ncbi:rod shape-determining protein MreC [Neisseria leonii]|uniref:Cell shape-determining protein MreC n=1 Tax=Neisseria leonii TaxID=2995413 RepID=A0A9X4IEL3_9NEIS|nr:rod shape-determining protein MreC [Neisseria sp. 51.81]MDD9328317.1 rod shape-determining protein MreC [Neisseria sp. 51.81]
MPEELSFTHQRIRPASKFIVLSLVSTALMMLDTRYDAVRLLKGHVATALQPVQWLANQPVRLYDSAAGFWQEKRELLAENGRLKNENIQLRTAAGQSAHQARELAELRMLQGLQNQGIQAGTAAEIISNGRDPLSDKVIINRGGRNGVRNGDAVIDQSGLYGQVTRVQPFSAEVTLLTNGQTVIPVMVARTGVRTLVYGSGNRLSLPYFPADAELLPSDFLVTSGLDSVYPAGIPVARVQQAQRASGTPYYQAAVSPAARIRSSKYLLVLPQTQTPDTGPPAPEAATP